MKGRRTRGRGWAPVVLVVVAAGGCGGTGSTGAAARPAPPDPAELEAAFHAMEERLLATPFDLPFEVTAEGAIAADLVGRLAVGEGNRALLEARGVFAGQPVDLYLRSDGERLFTRVGEARTADVPVPPDLGRALVIGLTRMGVLHNVARLTGEMLPDHAEGGVAAWVQVEDFAPARLGRERYAELYERMQQTAGVVGMDGWTVDLRVAGTPSGSATLVVDHRDRPFERWQRVDFPQGQMRVHERYRPAGAPADSLFGRLP